MWAVRSDRINDFLGDHGLFPDFEIYGTAFYQSSDYMRELMDLYYIRYVCIPNRLGG